MGKIGRSQTGDKNCTGFTLIELMMVISVIAILAAIAVPQFLSYRQRAKIAVCIAGIKVIEQAVVSHFLDTGAFPESLAEVGLDKLQDPWGNPYQYFRIQGLGNKATGKARKDRFLVPINSDFDLYSLGPDGQSVLALTAKASRDDIIRANDGQYVGRAAGY